MSKRFLGLLVAITMLVTVLPTAAFATDTPQDIAQVEAQQPNNLGEEAADANEVLPEAEPPPAEDGDPSAEENPTTDSEPVIDTALADAATAAIAALPSEITWDAFAAVEAAGAAYAAVPAELKPLVVGADRLQLAIDALLQIYANALSALDPTADIWENQHQIKAFAEMKKQMDAALYIKPASDGDTTLMDGTAEPAADLSWLDVALLAYANAEATIIPAGGDAELTATHGPTNYQTLQNALNAVKDDEVIQINKDITIENGVELEAKNNVKYEIDTNNKTVTLGANGVETGGFVISDGYVTINGGGLFTLPSVEANNDVVAIRVSGDNTVLEMVDIRISVDVPNRFTALRVDAAREVRVGDCKLNMACGLYQMGGAATIANTSIGAYMPGDVQIAACPIFLPGSADTYLTLDDVRVHTNQFRVLCAEKKEREWTNNIYVTVKNYTKLISTRATADVVIADNGGAQQGDVQVNLSDVVTYPALKGSTYYTNQKLFDTPNGGSVLSQSLSGAIETTDVKLRENYNATNEALSVPEGHTLDLGSYTLQKDGDYPIFIKGTLKAENTSKIKGAVSLADSATLMVGTTLMVAPLVNEDEDIRPVFGLHKDAEMSVTAKVQGEDKGFSFTVSDGEVTLQSGFDFLAVFEGMGDHSLAIWEGATVWLPPYMSLTATTGITEGELDYVIATNATGKTNYKTLKEAIEKTNSVKLVRNATDMLSQPTLTIDKALTLDLNGHSLHMAKDAKLNISTQRTGNVVIKNGTIAHLYSTTSMYVSGTEGGSATFTLQNVKVYDAINYLSHARIIVKDSNISSVSNAIYAAKDVKGAQLTIDDCELLNRSEEGSAIVLQGDTTLRITETDISSWGDGVLMHSGNATLTNVNATTEQAAVRVNPSAGDSVELTLGGGKYTSSNCEALNFQFASGANRENAPVSIFINGAALESKNLEDPISGTQDIAKNIMVTSMVTWPQVRDVNYTIVEGNHCFVYNSDDRVGTIVSKDLNAALAQEKDIRITLAGDYANPKEKLAIGHGAELYLNGYNLTVASIQSYGYINALTGGAITAKKIEQYGSAYGKAGVYLGTLTRLATGTTLELLPFDQLGRTQYPYFSLGDYADGLNVIGPDRGTYYPFVLGQNARMSVAQTKDENQKPVLLFTVLAGEVELVGKTEGEIDLHGHYLTVAPKARVTVADGYTLPQTDHIKGNIVYPDVVKLETAIRALPKKVDKLTYLDYETVNAAVDAWGVVETNRHHTTPAAQAAKKLLDPYLSVYIQKYVETAPAEHLLDVVGGTHQTLYINDPFLSVVDCQKGASVPEKVWTWLESTLSLVVELSDTTGKFVYDTNNSTISATSSAAGNDTAVLTLYYTNSSVETPITTKKLAVTYRAVPQMTNATLAEILPLTYTHTVNLQHKSQAVEMEVIYAYSNGMRYDLEGYTVAKSVTVTGTLGEMYTAAYDNTNIVTLTPKDVPKLQKNKTYTGKLQFSVRRQGNNYPVPATAVISVKVTDVKPKVSVKFSNVSMFYSKIGSPESGYQYKCVNGFTLTGANASDVKQVKLDGLSGVTFVTYDGGEGDIGFYDVLIKTAQPLDGTTLKPNATLIFKDESGFKDVPLVNSKGQTTASIKPVNKLPAIKLAQSSAIVGGTAGTSITVQLKRTNSDDYYAVRGIDADKVKVLETVNNIVGESSNVSVAIQDKKRAGANLVFTLNKPITADLKVMVQFSYEYAEGTVSLPFTFKVKPITAKLGTNTVKFNVTSAIREVDVPITVSPTTEVVSLAAVNGEPVTDGVVTVNGITFTCVNERTLHVGASGVALNTGKTKYSLTFAGVAKAVSLTVNVVDEYQTVKLAKTSVSLNTTLRTPTGGMVDVAAIPVLYSDGTLSEDDVVSVTTSSDEVVANYGVDGDNVGYLYVHMFPTAKKTETVTLTVDAETTRINPKKATLKLTVKQNTKPITMKGTVYGKLSTSDPRHVYMQMTLSGSMASMTMQELCDALFGEDGSADVNWQGSNKLSIMLTERDYEKPASFVTLVTWAMGADRTAGKPSANLSVVNSSLGINLTLAKPLTITAVAPGYKLATQTATLYGAMPCEHTPIAFYGFMGGRITAVKLTKPSAVYAVEPVGDGFGIRYLTNKPFDGKKWKATDSVQLSVTMAGVAKPITVKLPIVNVQAQPPATE